MYSCTAVSDPYLPYSLPCMRSCDRVVVYTYWVELVFCSCTYYLRSYSLAEASQRSIHCLTLATMLCTVPSLTDDSDHVPSLQVQHHSMPILRPLPQLSIDRVQMGGVLTRDGLF
jgi:hypothetical protein